MKFLLVTMLPFFLMARLGCEQPIRGEFGWSSTDDRDLEEPELSLHMPRTYRLARKNLFFFDYETLWMVYQIHGGDYDKDENFLVALFENNNTPNPVEADLRQVQVQMDDKVGFIRQQYDPLAPGKYLLKIAYISDVFDQIEFQVVSPSEPEELQDDSEGQDAETDDLLRYSTSAAR